MDKISSAAAVRRVRYYGWAFLKWTVCAVAAGLCCGVAGGAFYRAVAWAGERFTACPWLLFLLPAAGLVIVWTYRAWGIQQDQGTNLVLQSLRGGPQVPLKVAVLIFLGTVLTHLCGGSSGKEGAALQIGAGLVGSGIALPLDRLFHLDEKDRRLMTMCGMSGLFAAVFGTPATAALFSMEVVEVGVLRYAAFYPCLVASLTAWKVSQAMGVHGVSFPLAVQPAADLDLVLRVTVLTILCAGCSILFLTVMHGVGHLYRRLIADSYLRVAVGGCLVILATLLVGSRDYNGAGLTVISAAIGGEAVPWAFLMKILFTALTLGAGFKGGEIVPTFFVGATFGCTVGPLLGLDPGFGAAVGLVALFCSVVNCPVASLILSMELFGGDSLLLFALVCSLSYLMSGYYSLYDSQRIIYSKLGTEPKE